MDKSMMPECYADTLLIETFVPPKTGYNHKHSCYKVESEMKASDKFAVGIIDKDKRVIPYLLEFVVIDIVAEFVILYKHKTKQQYIIQIIPALEKWILNICAMEGIDLKGFGFKADLAALKAHTKQAASMENEKLKKLFEEISTRDNNIAVRKLKWWLKVLKQKNYYVDINELKNG